LKIVYPVDNSKQNANENYTICTDKICISNCTINT